jgi:hypothetical protein
LALLNDGQGSYFDLARAKTGKAAAGTLSQWSEAILNTYLGKLGVELHDAAPIFWTRGGTSTAKGGRPWPPRPYLSDRLGIDFRKIRALVFGPNDVRHRMACEPMMTCHKQLGLPQSRQTVKP